jgi:hypothetical protein
MAAETVVVTAAETATAVEMATVTAVAMETAAAMATALREIAETTARLEMVAVATGPTKAVAAPESGYSGKGKQSLSLLGPVRKKAAGSL